MNLLELGMKAVVRVICFSFVDFREPSPSNHCVDWMCDEEVLWLRSMEDSLEIIAYYSTENNTIPSWSKCLHDDGKEFLKRNYTLINAGITYPHPHLMEGILSFVVQVYISRLLLVYQLELNISETILPAK